MRTVLAAILLSLLAVPAAHAEEADIDKQSIRDTLEQRVETLRDADTDSNGRVSSEEWRERHAQPARGKSKSGKSKKRLKASDKDQDEYHAGKHKGKVKPGNRDRKDKKHRDEKSHKKDNKHDKKEKKERHGKKH